MKLARWPIQKTNLGDKNYPAILREVKKAPKSLFYRGNSRQSLFIKSLAVVGTRRMTRYGRQVADRLIGSLVSEKVTIVSGFMYGVDSEAHQKCLEYGGQTVAVLGGGLNIIYPPENEKLYQQILDTNGVIFSEYEPEQKPQLWTFPQRNRIVAGLASLGVLVVEAGEKSGSLITARLAKQQGKKVFAVPGPITSTTAAGTNQLIKTHQAKMVTSAEDILGKKMATPSLFDTTKLTTLEKKIFEALQTEPLTADELARITGQNITKLGQTLSLMSLKGFIAETAGKFFLNF